MAIADSREGQDLLQPCSQILCGVWGKSLERNRTTTVGEKSGPAIIVCNDDKIDDDECSLPSKSMQLYILSLHRVSQATSAPNWERCRGEKSSVTRDRNTPVLKKNRDRNRHQRAS